MTEPRKYEPGDTWFASARVLLGCFRLKPDEETTEVLLFLLAYAVSVSEIALHAFIGMPNHTHVLFTDKDGTGATKFLRTFHQLVALHLGRLQDLSGPFWCRSGPHLKLIRGPVSCLRKMVYTLTNAASAGLCDAPDDWFGLITRIRDIGVGPLTIERPAALTRFGGTLLPESVTITIVPPPGYEHLTASEFRRLLRREVQERAATIRLNRTRPVADRDSLEQRPILERPTEPPRRRQAASRDALMRDRIECDTLAMQLEAVESLRTFLTAYADAFERWRAGDREVRFPSGTYAMVQIHGLATSRGPD